MASKIRFGRSHSVRAMRRAFALAAFAGIAALSPAQAEPPAIAERAATALESVESQAARSSSCGPKRPRTSPRCSKSSR